jgi:hypothetical protein
MRRIQIPYRQMNMVKVHRFPFCRPRR